MLCILVYSPHGMLGILKRHLQMCAGSQEGAEEAGDEERDTKSRTANPCCTWPVGDATSISEARAILCKTHVTSRACEQTSAPA